VIVTKLYCTAHGEQPADPERAISYCPRCGRFLHPVTTIDIGRPVRVPQ